MPGDNDREASRPGAGEAVDLFRRALLALKDGRNDSVPGAHLRESARLLVDSRLAARGYRPQDDEERMSLLRAHLSKDQTTTRPIMDILSLDAPGAGPATGPADLEQLERRYRALLPLWRSALVRELPGHETIGSGCRRIAGSPTVRRLTGLAAAIAVLGAAAYHISRPQYLFDAGGQLFWTRAPGEGFTPQRSQRFTVHVDDTVHNYLLRLPSPVVLHRLRLDPVNRVEARRIDVLGLELLGQEGRNARLTARGGESWSCVNCEWLSRGQRAWRLRPDNDDPQIAGPVAASFRVDAVRIKMRASATKTFWEWLTRLERKP